MRRFLVLLLCMCLLCGCASDPGAYIPTGDALSGGDATGPQTKPEPEAKPQKMSLPYYRELSLNPYLCTDFTNRALLPLLYQSLFTVKRALRRDGARVCRFCAMTRASFGPPL